MKKEKKEEVKKEEEGKKEGKNGRIRRKKKVWRQIL